MYGKVIKHLRKCFYFVCLKVGGVRRMAAGQRNNVTLACVDCKNRNYITSKNKKNDPDRIEMMKYCKFCKDHTLHKETK